MSTVFRNKQGETILMLSLESETVDAMNSSHGKYNISEAAREERKDNIHLLYSK